MGWDVKVLVAEGWESLCSWLGSGTSQDQSHVEHFRHFLGTKKNCRRCKRSIAALHVCTRIFPIAAHTISTLPVLLLAEISNGVNVLSFLQIYQLVFYSF
ncbi:hypothetical protein OIU76_007333 [Salix suchowensis]|nr:hypothetical protein OIU76_007333 [Salix suchowensis]